MTKGAGTDYVWLQLKLDELYAIQEEVYQRLIDMGAPMVAIRATHEIRKQAGTVHAIMFDEQLVSIPQQEGDPDDTKTDR